MDLRIAAKYFNYLALTNLILLGMLMIIPGIQHLRDPAALSTLLEGLGAPIPHVLIWVIIPAMILSGTAIMLRWKLHLAVIVPISILVFAAFTIYVQDWKELLLRLVAATAYALVGLHTLIAQWAREAQQAAPASKFNMVE